MLHSRESLERRIILLTLAGFLMPPAVWLASLRISNVTETWHEVLALALSPLMHIYVAAYMIAVVWSMRRRLKIIRLAAESGGEPANVSARRAARGIPVVFVAFMSAYCLLGPSTPLFGKEFISPTEYLLAELLAVPIILVFSIPFLIALVTATEQLAFGIPLSEKEPFYQVGTKMFFFSVVSISGGMLFLSLVAVSLLYKQDTLAGFSDAAARLLVCFLLMLAIMVFNLVRLRSQITRPVRQLDARLQQIASTHGDLTQRLDTYSRDEFGSISNSFNSLMVRIAGLIAKISESSGAIDAAAHRLVATAQILAESSSAQSDKLRSSLGVVHEVGGGLEENARSGLSAKNNMIATREQIESRGRDIADLRTTMDRVTEMMKIIGDIARQTNMLALNATIEAARAGEAGRGFAVVATEVGKLANSSRDSAREIETVVKSAREAVNVTVETFSRVDADIREGAALAERIAETGTRNFASLAEARRDLDNLAQLTVGLTKAADAIRESAAEIKHGAGALSSEVKLFRTA